jgi:DNA-binding NtrC family response regulator
LPISPRRNELNGRDLTSDSGISVDDEENLVVLLDWILSKEGYQVKTTNNAYEALDFVDQEDVRVAILDINMYPIDGVALLAEIKKRWPDGFPRDGHKKQLHENTER